MIPLSITRTNASQMSRASFELRIERATKDGLEAVMQEMVTLAERRTKALGASLRTHDGPNADKPPYVKGFKYRLHGSRLNWTAEFYNAAPDARVVEYGRRPGAKFPGPNSLAGKKIIGWAKDRGLVGQFKQRQGRSSVTGRFQSSRPLTEAQVLYMIRKSVRQKGRPAFHVMEFTRIEVLKRSSNGRTRLARLMKAALSLR